MGELLKKFSPVDVIALFVFSGGIILKLTGADGVVGLLLTSIVFYYFGKQRRYNDPKTS